MKKKKLLTSQDERDVVVSDSLFVDSFVCDVAGRLEKGLMLNE